MVCCVSGEPALSRPTTPRRTRKAFLGPTDLQPPFCVSAARCIDSDVARLELMRLYNEATVAQRSDQDGWEQIQLSLRELARQWAGLRPHLVLPFSNDGLVSITEKARTDLPLDVVDVGHVEDAPDNGTPQGLLPACPLQPPAASTIPPGFN